MSNPELTDDDALTSREDVVVSLHDAHHERLHDHVFVLLDHLVDRDFDAARATFSTLRTELEAGLALEDDLILPLYASLPLPSPQGRVDHVHGDHVILVRTLDAIALWATTLTPSTSRREVFVGLPVVYRLLGTLEHHHERERQHVYPTVAPALSSSDRARVVDVLRRLVAGAPQP